MNDVVIVGGGTAGWLTALILQQEAKASTTPFNICLVESSKIPNIGVGEGTTSLFRGVLQALGLDEMEFVAATGATIKYGIRHRDWKQLGHVYDGPIDDVYHLADRVPGAGQWLDNYCCAAGRSVTEPHLFSALMAGDKAPFAERGKEFIPLSQFHHAYHFDQAKVGQWLRSKAEGIRILDAVVEGAEQDPSSGRVKALHLSNGDTLEGRFFVDATGFRRTIIGDVMGVDWVDYSHSLPVNRAMPFWLDLPPEQDIPTYTHAWAQKAGWMWQIPTQERMGCGYVYSDHHVTPDQAQAEIEAVLGHKIEPRNDIQIKAGRLSKVLCKNVLAIGLSSSFLEPLEATSIHGTLVTILLFAKRHLSGLDDISNHDEDRFNHAIGQQVDDFKDFINLHYVSHRRDSVFWNDVASQFIQSSTHERIQQWSKKMPGPEDFSNDLDGLPHLEELLHIPVLDGLGLLNQSTARKEMGANPKLRHFARETVDFLVKQSRQAEQAAMGHRDWLNKIHQQVAGSSGAVLNN